MSNETFSAVFKVFIQRQYLHL